MEYPIGKLVPRKKRLSVYKTSLVILKSGNKRVIASLGIGLCLILPCILWRLTGYLQDAPNCQPWDWDDTEKMFPEIKEWCTRVNTYTTAEERMAERIKELEKIIKHLEDKKDATNNI